LEKIIKWWAIFTLYKFCIFWAKYFLNFSSNPDVIFKIFPKVVSLSNFYT
jgi:hypothetical protein